MMKSVFLLQSCQISSLVSCLYIVLATLTSLILDVCIKVGHKMYVQCKTVSMGYLWVNRRNI